MNEKKVWEILGIEDTADEAAVREAYRQRLLHTNPEDDPEGFKMLREAYEKAVELLNRRKDSEENAKARPGELTPLEQLMADADSIYEDIPSRRDLSLWKKWADTPLIQGLDTVDQVRQEFLVYTQTHFHYPTRVWQFFDEIFRITDESAALMEVFPENYIRFILSHINEPDYFTYDAIIPRSELDFAPVCDIPLTAEMHYEDESNIPETDKYIRNVSGLYHLFNAVLNKFTPPENVPKILDEFAARLISLRSSHIYHPFEMVALLRYLDFTDRNAEGLPVALHFLTPETIPVLDDFSLANMGFFLVKTWYKDGEKDPSEIRFVLDAFERVLSHEPHYVLANFGRSIYHFMTSDYEKADEEVLLALEFADQNRSIEEFVDLVDEKLLAHYEKCIAENPGDVRSAIEAGWCYLRKDNSDKALELLKGIVPDEENEYSYYNLYARCYIKNEQIKEAEPHLLKWQSYLLPLYERKQAGEELTAEENKRLERLGYSYYLLALSRKEKGEPDEAFALMDMAIARSLRDDEQIRYTAIKGQMLNEEKRYDTAIELWNGLIERVPDYAAAYALRQEAAFYGRNAGLVIEDFWNVVDMIPDYPKAYVYAAKVYNIYERSDLFDEMLQVAERNGINSMALSLEHAKKLKREKDYTAAKEIFQKLMPEMDSEACDIENPSEFYNEYAMTLYNLGRQQKDPEVLSHLLKESMVITEKSISINDLSRQAHWIKTDILEALKEDAAPEYENMLQLFSDDPDVFYEYGMYLKRQKKKDEALKYFEKTLVLDEGHASAHEKISDYYLDSFADTEDMVDYRAAVDHSLKQLDNQANAYFYISLGLVYIEGNEFEKALEAGRKAVEDDPGDIYAYNVVAYSLMMLKRYDEAEEAFKKGNALLEGNPINTALQRNYIRFLEMRRRYSEAIDYALAYHEQFHLDNTGTHETMAKLYKRNRDYENALRECDIIQTYLLRALQKEGPEKTYKGISEIFRDYPAGEPDCYASLTANQVRIMEIFYIMENYPEYEASYADLLDFAEHSVSSIDPAPEVNKRYISSIYRELGRHEMFVRRDYEAAIKHLKQAEHFREETLPPDKPLYILGKLRLELAEALMRAGRTEEAAAKAKDCITHLVSPNKTIEACVAYPNSRPLRYSEMAKYYYLIGLPEKAEAMLEKMCEFPLCSFCRESDCYDRLLTRANIEEMSGAPEQALESYKLALAINNTDAELYAAIKAIKEERK